jgi:hypothetical protein
MLQLSRWGEAFGLAGPISDTDSLPADIAQVKELPLPVEMLGRIIKLIKEAETKSNKYNIVDSGALVVYDPDQDQTTQANCMHG